MKTKRQSASSLLAYRIMNLYTNYTMDLYHIISLVAWIIQIVSAVETASVAVEMITKE